jgi:DNA-binding transcriptional MerR regulator
MQTGSVKFYFSIHEAIVITGFTKYMLDYLSREEIFAPSINARVGRGIKRQYTYEDLVLLRVLHRICAANGKIRHLKDALLEFRQQFGPLKPGQKLDQLLFVQGNELCTFTSNEGDTVIGAAHQQALVTLNERTSRYCLIAHVPAKTAQAVSDAVISLLTPFADCVHTLTTDNGKEFAQHERIARTLGADFFFAHPYASWERGANENMNGLIRQFFPKKCRFDSITQKDIAHAMDRLNHRPRKCLGFKTPHEVFMTQLHLRHNSVALQT